jgi:hypothetical protein
MGAMALVDRFLPAYESNVTWCYLLFNAIIRTKVLGSV